MTIISFIILRCYNAELEFTIDSYLNFVIFIVKLIIVEALPKHVFYTEKCCTVFKNCLVVRCSSDLTKNCTSVIQSTDMILSVIDNKQLTAVVLLDMSKALIV